MRVPYDWHTPYIFDGEEISLGVRAWTWGYDLYQPDRGRPDRRIAGKASALHFSSSDRSDDRAGRRDTAHKSRRRVRARPAALIQPARARSGLGAWCPLVTCATASASAPKRHWLQSAHTVYNPATPAPAARPNHHEAPSRLRAIPIPFHGTYSGRARSAASSSAHLLRGRHVRHRVCRYGVCVGVL